MKQRQIKNSFSIVNVQLPAVNEVGICLVTCRKLLNTFLVLCLKPLSVHQEGVFFDNGQESLILTCLTMYTHKEIQLDRPQSFGSLDQWDLDSL